MKFTGRKVIMALACLGFMGPAWAQDATANIVNNGEFHGLHENKNNVTAPGWEVSGKFDTLVTRDHTDTIGIRLVSSGSFIQQTLTTIPGQTYDITFLTSRSTNGTVPPLEVSVGSERQTFSPTERGIHPKFSFVATGASTILKFVAPKTDGEHGPFIEQVVVTRTDSSSLLRKSAERAYADYADTVRQGHLDKLTNLYTTDYACSNFEKATQSAKDVVAELTGSKDRKKLAVVFKIKEIKGEGADVLATVERRVSFEEKGTDGVAHRHVIISLLTDTWTGTPSKLKSTSEESREHTVDGEAVSNP